MTPGQPDDHLVPDLVEAVPVPRGAGLVSVLTVAENVSVALRARGRAPRDADAEARAALARTGLAHVADLVPHGLDDEQVQRVLAARGSVVGPVDPLVEDGARPVADANVRDVSADPPAPAAAEELEQPVDHAAFRRPGS